MSSTYDRILSDRRERRPFPLATGIVIACFSNLGFRPIDPPRSEPAKAPERIFAVSVDPAAPAKIAHGALPPATKQARRPEPPKPAPRAAETPKREEPEAAPLVESSEATPDTAAIGEAQAPASGDVSAHAGEPGASERSGHGSGDGEGDGAGSAPDLSRNARPRSWAWACNWPLFARTNDATVTVRVRVDTKGDAESVEVISATHPEFVRDARECAKNRRYHPAQDAQGVAVAGVSDILPIHFQRINGW